MRKPHRIARRIVGAFDKGRQPRGIIPGKMPLHRKTLGMKIQRHVRIIPRQRADTRRKIAGERLGRSAQANTHGDRNRRLAPGCKSGLPGHLL
jgi:hypothetical protein